MKWGEALAGSAGRSGGTDFEREHGRSVVVETLGQLLVGPVLGLAASDCPHATHILVGIAQQVAHVIPVIRAVGQHFPLLERQRLGHLAVLHLPGRVVVADAFLRVAVEDDADVVTAVGDDHARLTVGYHSPPDLGRHIIVAVNVVAVVASHGFLRACAALRGRTRRLMAKC